MSKPRKNSKNGAGGVALVLLGRNLRLEDSEAMLAAAATGRPVIGLDIISDERGLERPLGAAAKWWRWRSLLALDKELRKRGSGIVLRQGEILREVADIVRRSDARSLHFNWRPDPAGATGDKRLVALCRDLGIAGVGHAANYLHDPSLLRTGAGGHFKVFTPFWNRLQASYAPSAQRLAAPRFKPVATWPGGEDLSAIALAAPWADRLSRFWRPGASSADRVLNAFIDRIGERYPDTRNSPGLNGTSHLSPHLAFGEISVHEIWRRLHEALGGAALPALRQIGWRDFHMHLTAASGDLSAKPIRREFSRFPYVKDQARLRSWQRGVTGYPIVDAGMRELWATGWMHNRVRMIAASFLIKDLLIDWREGEAWFWDTLVDADAAQNPGNWQWIAGCGADAAPYFRIFNPVTQARRFDSDGAYVRRWVPELARLSTRHLHAPWQAPASELEAACVRLGRDYPLPVVDHRVARERALVAYKRMRGKARQ